MALVLGPVVGPFHGPQQKRADKLPLAAGRACRQNLLDDLRISRHQTRLHGPFEPIEFLEHGNERAQGIGGRRFVDAVQAGKAAPLQVAGHRLVGQDHGLLHQARGIGLATQRDVGRPSLRIEDHLGLGRGEVDAAGPGAGRLPGAGEPRAFHEPPGNIAPRGDGGLVVDEDVVGLAVGKARVRADEGRVQREAHELSLIVQEQVGRHGTPLGAGRERAQLVGKSRGQHGDDAVGQIHARGAPTRVQIDRGAPGHVVAHVGDVHAEPPQPLFLQIIQGQRIVEIFGVGRIDGEGEAVAQVAVAGGQGPLRIQGRRGRISQSPLREHRLQLVAADDEVDAGPRRVGGIGEHLFHKARGGAAARRELGDAHAHERPVGHLGRLGAHGEHVVGNARIGRDHHSEGLGHLVAPHQRVVGPIDHREHPGGGTTRHIPVVIRDSPPLRCPGPQRRDFHQIAVERAGEARGGDEVLPLGRLHETEAAGAHGENAPGIRLGAAARVLPVTAHPISLPL